MPYACEDPQQHAHAGQCTLIPTPVHAEPGDVGPCILKFPTQPQPCPEDHVLHHPGATAEPWHHCDETWDPQQLSISSRPLAETENPNPCRILQGVLEFFSVVELFQRSQESSFHRAPQNNQPGQGSRARSTCSSRNTTVAPSLSVIRP